MVRRLRRGAQAKTRSLASAPRTHLRRAPRGSAWRSRAPGQTGRLGGSRLRSTGAHLCLVGALRGLVGLEGLDRVDVAKRGEVRGEWARHLDAEALQEDGAQRQHLHVAEAGERADPLLEVLR